jgi:hypothetical protein
MGVAGVDIGELYKPIPGEPPKNTPVKKCSEKCKSAAKKAFDVLCLFAGLALMTAGVAFVIGEKANVQPNRGAGLGSFFLRAIIVKGNYDAIRNWR